MSGVSSKLADARSRNLPGDPSRCRCCSTVTLPSLLKTRAAEDELDVAVAVEVGDDRGLRAVAVESCCRSSAAVGAAMRWRTEPSLPSRTKIPAARHVGRPARNELIALRFPVEKEIGHVGPTTMLGVSPERTLASVGTVPNARPSGLPFESSSRLSGGDSHLKLPSRAFRAA